MRAGLENHWFQPYQKDQSEAPHICGISSAGTSVCLTSRGSAVQTRHPAPVIAVVPFSRPEHRRPQYTPYIDTYSKIFIRRIAGSNPVELTLSFWRNGLRIDLKNRLSIYVSSYAGIV